MKKNVTLFGLAVLVTAIVFGFAACKNGTTPTSTPTPFTSIAEFKAWLAVQSANTAATAYTVKLNVSSLSGDSETAGSVGKAIKDSGKFVNLDLSGSNLPSIGNNAFSSCESLTSITIPSGVTSIGISAFDNCDSLTSVTIPSGVTRIEASAFVFCRSLASVTIGSGVTSIGNYAFDECDSLTSVTFQGTIAEANFSSTEPFPGDLRATYLATGGGVGTYTRSSTSSTTWTKQL